MRRISSHARPSLHRPAWIAWTLLALAMLVCTPSHALRPGVALSQYLRTSWKVRDGLPGTVRSFGQTADGYLWIGTTGGLVKFDGVTFEPVDQLGAENIRNVVVIDFNLQADGRMVLGTEGRAAVSLIHGIGRAPGRAQQLYDVANLAAARDGTVWATCNLRLCRLDDDHFVLFATDDHFPDADVQSLAIDRFGTMWALSKAAGGSLYFKKPGAPFAKVAGHFDAYQIGLADDHVVVSGPQGLQAVADVDGAPGASVVTVSHESSALFLVDRDDNLWVGTPTGLRLFDNARARLAGTATDRPANTLAFDHASVYAMFEDSAGDVWIGTTKGLERFRNARLVNVALTETRESEYYTMGVAPGTGIWAANPDPGILRIDRIAAVEHATPILHPGLIYASDENTLWMTSASGLWRSIRGERFERVSPADFGASRSLVMDASGALWIDGGVEHPVSRLYQGELTHPAIAGLPAGWNFRASFADSAGRLWFSCPDALVVVEGGVARSVPYKSDGLDFGHATTFFERNGHVWIGGSSGLGIVDGRHFRTLFEEYGKPITGVVETRDGDLWLNGRDETLFVAAADVREALARSQPFAHMRHFNLLDGRNGAAIFSQLMPSLVEDQERQLWVSTDAGVAWIDTRDLARRAAMPTPVLLSFQADGKSYPLAQRGDVPALPQHLAFTYTAPALSVPERVRFRYRLEGVDADWQDAGTRRDAFYNNLGPGLYRFRMGATNEDGEWNSVEASVEFRVAPAWFQTTWFRALCTVAVLGLLFLLHRMRLMQLSRRMALQQHAQLMERERIARELHDTLLQSVAGLRMLFHSVAEAMPVESEQRARVDTALERADQALAEGRDRVHGLRSANRNDEPLAAALRRVADSLHATDDATRVNIHASGDELALRQPAHDELVSVLTEGLRNAFKHAQARHIDLRLDFARRHFAAVLHDDGKGMRADLLSDGKRMHWGLLGMRERVARLGGHYEIASVPGEGTTISIRLPAAIAYERRPG